MINTIIFSKDRPAQLDLLLRSLSQSPVKNHINVLYRSSEEYLEGYSRVQSLHPNINLVEECDFRSDLLKLLDGQLGGTTSKFTQFFCDDDIMYCPPDFTQESLEELFKLKIVAFSLRLGRNTWCQTPGTSERVQFPNFVRYAGALVWDYKTVGYGNFGIPMSLDGTIYKTDFITDVTKSISFKGPNSYEATMFNISCGFSGFMSCLNKSSVVGVPINLVNTEFSNPHGQSFYQNPQEMNKRFLNMEKLYFDVQQINGAHQYVDLLWRLYEMD